MEKAKQIWKRYGRWSLGLVVTLLSIWWLLARDLDWGQVWAAWESAQYGWVLLGVLAVVGTIIARAQRWRLLLWQTDVGLWAAMTGVLVGQVGNMVMPLRGGDVVRAVWIAPEKRTGAPEAVGAIVVEKFFDLLALFISGLLLLLWMPSPDWLARSTVQVAVGLVLGTCGLLVVLYWRPAFVERLAARLAAPFGSWGQRGLQLIRRMCLGLASVRHPAIVGRVLLWTALNWILGIVINWVILAAFGIATFPTAVLLMVALMAGSAIPTPAGLGLFEGICVAILTALGISVDVAMAMGVILHMTVMAPPVVLAFLLTGLLGRTLRRRPVNGQA
ncbi:MAG: flippase-like domain-containing protein [Anaerolineae bacterium]|nr:flippase-like domain-containing protein [Anaerolineae bacterium]